MKSRGAPSSVILLELLTAAAVGVAAPDSWTVADGEVGWMAYHFDLDSTGRNSLPLFRARLPDAAAARPRRTPLGSRYSSSGCPIRPAHRARSEERRVGKECRS